jgi:uncharacterized protein YukE
MADRLLVSTEQMEATVTKYNDARERMEQAFSAMDKAWNNLCQVWDGTIKTTFMSEWIAIMGNIRKSDRAMERSINGLIKSNNLFTQNESELQSRANNLETGTVPPMF